MSGYHYRWHDAGYTTLTTEEQFKLPIVNPDTCRPSKTFEQAGVYDGIIARDNQHFLLEHKTTSDQIHGDSTYWNRLDIDSQVSMYVLSHWQRGIKLSGTVYDVIRKPNIKPKTVPRTNKTGEIKLGTMREVDDKHQYYGWAISDSEYARLASDEFRETPWMFTARLAQDCCTRPEWYFRRKMIPRLDHEIVEWAYELWHVSQAIRDSQRTGRNFRNSAACMSYGRPCAYLGICSGHDEPDSDRWENVDKVHAELDTEDDGRNLLTNSRISTYQTCRRKHYYRYELGIRKQNQEDSEALHFGSLMHEALRAWFDHFKEIPDGNGESTDSFADNGDISPVQRSQQREEPTTATDSSWWGGSW